MCLCPMRHPAVSRGEHVRRLESEQGVGILWRHSGVNLVEPRSFTVARQMPRPWAGMQSRLASRCPSRNCGPVREFAKMGIISH
jgi:hypothetical protein